MGEYKNRFDEIEVALPLGYLLDQCSDWDKFCVETGLNPWVLNEGIASSEDTHYVKIGILRKYGILKN